jgi:hypothetical protein
VDDLSAFSDGELLIVAEVGGRAATSLINMRGAVAFFLGFVMHVGYLWRIKEIRGVIWGSGTVRNGGILISLGKILGRAGLHLYHSLMWDSPASG